MDYSDICRSFDRCNDEEETKRENITVDISGLREHDIIVDSEHVENNNWTHESSNEVNAALVSPNLQETLVNQSEARVNH